MKTIVAMCGFKYFYKKILIAMKNKFRTLLLILVSVLVAGNSYSRGAEASDASIIKLKDDDQMTNKKRIVIRVVRMEIPSTRSGILPVEAYLDIQNNLIEFVFNQNIGEMTITLLGPSGIEIATCDTAMETLAHVPLAPVTGCYVINIIGQEYEGYAQFEI